MKKIIRTVLFIFLSLYVTDWAIGGFSYSENKTIYLSMLALLVLYLFLRPVASVVSLPTSGSVFFLISFISTGIVFYALANIIYDLSFQPTTLKSLNILSGKSNLLLLMPGSMKITVMCLMVKQVV